jgi:hypothetical protein
MIEAHAQNVMIPVEESFAAWRKHDAVETAADKLSALAWRGDHAGSHESE